MANAAQRVRMRLLTSTGHSNAADVGTRPRSNREVPTCGTAPRGRSDPTNALNALERLGGRGQRARVLLCLVAASMRQDRGCYSRRADAPTIGRGAARRIGFLAV